MKKILYLLVCMIMASSCKEKAPAPLADGLPVETDYYAIPLETAVQYISRYDSVVGKYFKDSVTNPRQIPINGFTIRVEDVMEVAGLPPPTIADSAYVRAYIGMDSLYKLRLLMVPVKGANLNKEPSDPGEDIIPDGLYLIGRPGEKSVMPFNGKQVMDFTSPCPPTCPESSPLYPKKP
jgi:hypothetical protein